MDLKKDVERIITDIVKDINPYNNTFNAINNVDNKGKLYVVSIGKAAYVMGKAASDKLKNRITKGVIITKYHHSKGLIDNFEIFEAGHPIVDENSLKATQYVLNLTTGLTSDDKVIFLISGGGSALFEKPCIELSELQDINNQLLNSGATINEINMIRKRLSLVKGGKFAKHCKPAKVECYILSDVVGDDIASIASGPCYKDNYHKDDVKNIIDKYHIALSDNAKKTIDDEEDFQIDNVTNTFVGSLKQLCASTKTNCEKLGYKTYIMQDDYVLDGDDLANKIGKLAIEKQNVEESAAYIFAGEATIKVRGNGLGGRNQHIALASSLYLKDCHNTCVFCFGSDGTDGPTDACGGYTDEKTYSLIGNIEDYINNNDAYNALKKSDGLLITGPTGTNVNDVYVLLIKR